MTMQIHPIIHKIAKDFTLEFIANPYLCYTEHGLHALFYTMLFNALPAEQRYTQWGNKKVCVIQKEYPTAGRLGKPQRQHWDIAVIKTPSSSLLAGESLSYDYLRLAAVVEFGMNEAEEHLVDDIRRICHAQANLELGIIVHLYRLSTPGARISNRDWSPNSPRILSKEEVLKLIVGKQVDIYYGMADSTGNHPSGAWSINQGSLTRLD
jgi:hypothetical protein